MMLSRVFPHRGVVYHLLRVVVREPATVFIAFLQYRICKSTQNKMQPLVKWPA